MSTVPNLKTHIAIIDDDSQIRAVLRRVLEGKGYCVHEAADGYGAIELAIDTPLDLAMINILMPNMGGIDAMLRIRTFRQDLTFVVMTGIPNTRDDAFINVMEVLHVAHVIEKPFDLQEAVKVVRRFIKN